MNNKYLIVIIAILSVIAIISSHKDMTTNFNDEIYISVKSDNNIDKIALENYVIGVVAGEMPASFNEEALKAQAIAARTFAVNKMQNSKEDYDVYSDKRSQVYITVDDMHKLWNNSFDKYYERVKKAVMDTEGEVLTYNDEVIAAYYFAISNGYTEDVSLVFGGSKDYLVSMESNWDKKIKNYEVTKEYTKDEFLEKLGIKGDIVIGKIDYSNTGRVNSIVINNKLFKGTEVRKLLGLRSTDFSIKVGDFIEITTRGYGHGVGMSQYGANEMAKMGYKYEDILKHYYQNVSISKI